MVSFSPFSLGEGGALLLGLPFALIFLNAYDNKGVL
jgi:hypothetical protein